jgi:glutamyl-Q tRNA(Asp) synthetase
MGWPQAARRAWRLRVDGAPVRFEDRVFGPHSQSLETETGDFVVLRADGLFAYQLAVVVDGQ